jgi:hypothetical protein
MDKTLHVLNELERDGVIIRYAIGGAMTATFYVEPVLTFDLDIFVLLPRSVGPLLPLTPVYEALRQRGYMEADEYVTIEGVPVLFLPAFNPNLSPRRHQGTKGHRTTRCCWTYPGKVRSRPTGRRALLDRRRIRPFR